MDGKEGEAVGGSAELLPAFSARLAARLEAVMDAFQQQKPEPANVEKDAKAIAALGRAAIIIHQLKAAEDKSTEPPARRSAFNDNAHNDNHAEGDEMEPDERGHTGRSDEELATLRADVERRFERLARSFEQKRFLPEGTGGDAQPDEGLLARMGETGTDPALE